MDDTQSNRPFRSPWSSVSIIAVATVGLLTSCRENPPAPPKVTPTVQKLTRDQSLKLLELRDRAVALMENQEFEQADAVLLEIMKQLPDDPFAPRNLVITRELAPDKIDASKHPEKHHEAIQKLQTAVEQLLKSDLQSHVPHVLAARVANRKGNPELAAAELRKATEIAPTAAPVWYDLYLLKPTAPGETPEKQTVEALRKTYELLPDNLFVLKDWLTLQTQLKEPGLSDTVVHAKETLDPFVEVIKSHIRLDVRQLLDRLAKAIEEKQWSAAMTTSMTIRNVIVAESSRDERYVRWNSLEYMLFDFGPEFYKRADLPEPATNVIAVKFAAGTPALANPSSARELVARDFDLDGQLDSAVLVGGQVVVSFPAVSASSMVTLELGEGFEHVLAVDLDDDIDKSLKIQSKLNKNAAADLDLIVYGTAGLKFFEQRAREDLKREFVPKSPGDNLAALRDVVVVTPGDLDLDGDLDLLTITKTGIQFWSNRGNWTFEDITSRSKLPATTLSLTAAAAVDWDRDTDLDVLVATADGLGLLENMHHGRFRWRKLEGEFAMVKGATSLSIEQLGSRPSWSVIASGPGGIQAIWTETTTAGLVSAKKPVQVTEAATTRSQSLDFDNDSVRDLVAISDGKNQLWRGLPDGTFQSHSTGAAGDLNEIVALAIADLDQDGDEDLLLGSNSESKWFSNDGGNANGWLDVMLIAEQRKPNEQNYSKRVNNLGIGSMIEVRSGTRYLAQVAQHAPTHFGLGVNKKAEVLRVLWTNGLPQNLIGPDANQRIYEEQILIGSCPYLYAWDGEKFAFVTDLLWNAPLGLKFAENVIAPWREWEYLKIDGDKLKPKDGQYQLRVTAELWEIEYFDEIKLFAVDHPADAEIFTNEKVGPPSLAEHKIHTVSKPYSLVAARDPHGKDILDQVKTRDGIYTRTYDRKLAQGLTNEHYLELDLGEWPQDVARENNAQPASITLFLTGWMYPGSTSLRVQHSQNPDLQLPRPPALHAVDAKGQWREVQPFMGFPGGKTKTIAVDISEVFPPGSTDHRLRIVTNMEFYWDAAWYTIGDQSVEFRQTELQLGSANLVDRGGVSLHTWPESGNGPDQFNYHHLVPGDAWPPIEGAFTRFGDVLPLLTTRDDHLVVLHPGDEMQLQFAVPAAPVPEGWVRDFVIYNVGWDKDCDPHTVYGETSEPLPFRDMTIYPFRDGEPRSLDADYVHYLKTYQTRQRPRSPFWNKISAGR